MTDYTPTIRELKRSWSDWRRPILEHQGYSFADYEDLREMTDKEVDRAFEDFYESTVKKMDRIFDTGPEITHDLSINGEGEFYCDCGWSICHGAHSMEEAEKSVEEHTRDCRF